MPIPPLSLQELLRFEHYFSALIRLLIVLRQSIFSNTTKNIQKYSIPFLVPIISTFTYIPLGAQYRPASLDVPLTQQGLS